MAVNNSVAFGGWLPGSCGGFHFHSQLPDRIPPSWLANPRNPAMSPHTRLQAPVTLTRSEDDRQDFNMGTKKIWIKHYITCLRGEGNNTLSTLQNGETGQKVKPNMANMSYTNMADMSYRRWVTSVSVPLRKFYYTRKHERPRMETGTDVTQGLHWPPCLASLGDPEISLQIYI